MRYIEDLRDEYVGKEVWVLGCGPSLDDFPKEFFDDRISIRVNGSFIRFTPKEDFHYIHWYHKLVTDWVREYDWNKEFFKKSIISLPAEGMESQDSWGEFKEDIIFMKWGQPTPREILNESVKAIIEGRPYIYSGRGTTLHTAIQAAFVMGAYSVTLCGCDFGSIDGKLHARKDGIDKFYDEMEGKSSHSAEEIEQRKKGMRRSTGWYAEEFAKYGRVLRCYFYNGGFNAGYREVTDEVPRRISESSQNMTGYQEIK